MYVQGHPSQNPTTTMSRLQMRSWAHKEQGPLLITELKGPSEAGFACTGEPVRSSNCHICWGWG